MTMAATLLSPNGRLRPLPFILAALVIYGLGAASHFLTAPGVMARASLWPFAAAQAVLIWCWYVLHAQRLRDAGRGAGLAGGVALLYVLSIVLLLILAVAFAAPSGGLFGNANASVALGLILIAYILSALTDASGDGLGSVMIVVLTAMAFVPTAVALIFTAWAASQPSAGKAV